ncbi:receptor-like protein eix1 [Quercus suber]|uniref:Receptor-like protein eix1 n=1 Tax=Quercus suber TaxID=58331 RepID=A0AAW0KA09_QUESU
MLSMLVLALACCHPNPHQRPSMRTVLQVLTGEVPPPLVPTERPAFMWPAMPPSFNEDAENFSSGSQLSYNKSSPPLPTISRDKRTIEIRHFTFIQCGLDFVDLKKIEILDLATNELHGKIPASIGELCNLKFFDISFYNLVGSLPGSLEGIENCLSRSPLPSLDYLGLSSNQLYGKLPNWLGQYENLVHLDLASNLFNGTLPDSLGQLSELVNFDVSSNKLIGILTESHFSKLTKQKSLHLGPNSFTLNVNSNWVPPFQLQDLYMGNCYLGTSIPAWL